MCAAVSRIVGSRFMGVIAQFIALLKDFVLFLVFFHRISVVFLLGILQNCIPFLTVKTKELFMNFLKKSYKYV